MPFNKEQDIRLEVFPEISLEERDDTLDAFGLTYQKVNLTGKHLQDTRYNLLLKKAGDIWTNIQMCNQPFADAVNSSIKTIYWSDYSQEKNAHMIGAMIVVYALNRNHVMEKLLPNLGESDVDFLTRRSEAIIAARKSREKNIAAKAMAYPSLPTYDERLRECIHYAGQTTPLASDLSPEVQEKHIMVGAALMYELLVHAKTRSHFVPQEVLLDPQTAANMAKHMNNFNLMMSSTDTAN
ncbi:MAG TPA: hypothetical protein VLF89_01970 [Candidatus Saccharimonadales bacterium]|nr:hypothetical protein [Candidatus Saccharimonadales bacterium]